jgi:serralysin
MSTIGTVADTGNALTDSLVWGSRWLPASGKVITVGYSGGGATFTPTAAEIAAINAVLALYERVINIDFQLVGLDNDYAADITFDFTNDNGATGNLGEAQPPGEGAFGNAGNENSSVVIYRDNYVDKSASPTLKQGSYDFITLLHEFGHALGLAHPHDNGGTTADPSTIFPGVTAAQDSYGTFNLNQGIYTMMSYNDGWRTASTVPADAFFGYEKTPMGLDIIALQTIYGANTTWAAGDNTYSLVSTNAAYTGYTCIWDTGGRDMITAPSATMTTRCTIDLRAATGNVDVGGGGYVSFIAGIVGGFTIAKGAVIENAAGAAGADILWGNAASNFLVGRGGKDWMAGGAGRDTFDFNTVAESAASTTLADTIRDFSTVYDHIDLRTIDARSSTAGVNDAFVFRGTAGFTGEGQIRYSQQGTDTFVSINTDTDSTAESIIRLVGLHTLSADDFYL